MKTVSMRYLVIVLIFLFACSPYRGMQKRSISVDGSNYSILIPKHYKRSEQKKDELGNMVQFYYYDDGAYLFFAKRAAGTMFPVDTSLNIGKEQLPGGLYYKMVNDKNKLSRDVLVKEFWYGYRNAEAGKQEALFDSAMNYVRVK
jgi:hypothetical protein